MTYFQDLMRLCQLSSEPLVYESACNPVKMGNSMPIAYGGFNSALSIQAAFHSLPGNSDAERSRWAIYSANGLFLGPTALDRPVQFAVTKLRDTRSFTTRFIVASQDFDGQPRKCFSVTVDFTLKTADVGPGHGEARLPLSYSISPSASYPPPDEILELQDEVEERVKRGEVDENVRAAVEGTFGLNAKVSTTKLIKGTIFDETLYGIVAKSDTPDQLSTPNVTQRKSADYFKSADSLSPSSSASNCLPLSSYALHASFLAFVIDGALAFYPLTQHGLTLGDAAACSTLDFALRFHDDELDCENYHLREIRTYCASRERTFSEAFTWDRDGRLVASVSQQCILRPHSKAKPAKL